MPGVNTFKVTAIDKAGNTARQIVRITYQANQMEFQFTSPNNGATLADNTAVVTGTFKAPVNTGITINGVVATQAGNTFYAQVPLQAAAAYRLLGGI